MNISKKYLNALKRIMSTVLTHYRQFGFIIVLLYYVLSCMAFIGAPLAAFLIGNFFWGPNGALFILVTLVLVSTPIFPVLQITFSILAERALMLIKLYGFFGIGDFAVRNAVENWCNKHNH